MTKPKIAVVGSSNTDLVVLVPTIPAPGQTVLGGMLQTVAGGKGANQAVAAARLGGAVSFIARVGDDAYGQRAVEGFQADGIDTTFVVATPNVASGVALIAVDEATGENAIVVAPGANACLSAPDILAAREAIESAAALIVSLEIPDEAVAEAVYLAHARGVPVILNPAPARQLPPEVLQRISVITPNQTERAFYGGAEALLEAGVGAVVTTLGEEGAHLHTESGIHHRQGHAVEPVDTVAAGDCFTGALAVELALGKTLPEAIHFANAAAALKVTRHGAQPGLPSREEVEKFLTDRA